MDSGTPSSTFLSEPTEGLTRFCSIREMRPLVTPGAARELTLREPVQLADVFETGADVDGHGCCRRIMISAQRSTGVEHVRFRYQPSNLGACWMPFTANRQFKDKPACWRAHQGMYYETPDGRKVLDGVAGLWCVNAGHGRAKITEAVSAPARRDGLRPAVPDGPPRRVRAGRTRWCKMRARRTTVGHVFFTNSGSESVDTALKIALAYHQARRAMRRACGC